ncbi:MAG: 3-deoxy-manno-octulosonate cytidylyltransferase [Odoribacter sp.]|nr:3-deoxy-manno-octulosonate cytidylyltransferase [Odoribacter sp.]
MEVLILIPARYASTRFPGKPLAMIGGKPMVQHVVEKAAAVSENVYVATDDGRIYDCVIGFGGKAVMTSTEHRSGTDRCYEAYRHVVEQTGKKYDVVVNIQGDEPFIQPEQVKALVACFEDDKVEIATLAKRFEQNADVFDPNKVKVVCSAKGTALYFSRSAIPFCRGIEKECWLEMTPFYKHVGMYAYRPEVLKEITALPQGRLEKAESLEQLRWLENGYTIAVRETAHESIGIDTPEDLKRAECH